MSNNVNEHFKDKLLDLLPYAVVWVKPVYDNTGGIIDFEICYTNERGNRDIGHRSGSIDRLRILRDFIPSADACLSNFQNYLHVYKTGQVLEYTCFAPHIKKYLEAKRQKLKDGVLSITLDREGQRQSEKVEPRQTAFLNSVLDASFNGIYSVEAVYDQTERITDFRFLTVNRVYTQMVGKPPSEIIGHNMLELFPQNRENGFFDHFCCVLEHGVPMRDEVHFAPQPGNYLWFQYAIVKLDSNTLVITFEDITEQKQALLKIEHQKNLLDNTLKHASCGISVTEVIRNDADEVIDGRTIIANDATEHFNKKPKEQYLSQLISTFDPNILTSPLFKKALVTLKTGEPILEHYFFEETHRWLEVAISRMDADHLINIFTDVTAVKEGQLEIAHAADKITKFINASPSGMSLFLPEKNANGDVIDFRFDITNNAFVAYRGVLPSAVIGRFVSEVYPMYKTTTNFFDNCRHTYATGETLRFEMHYTAEGIDAWLDVMTTKMEDGVLVTFTDLTNLKHLQLQLEKSIAELKRSNRQLEEFAHGASHDLKEPIRKIRIFAERLRKDLASCMSEEDASIFIRMDRAAKRMQLLIDDLLEYSHASTHPQVLEKIDINDILQKVLEDQELSIEENGATLYIDKLPVITGNRRQIDQLFQNLLSNGLKYRHPERAPRITITSKEISGFEAPVNLPSESRYKRFHLIEVADNGIGFEQKHAGRIFQIFQRLHNNNLYSGTGIGLSIARKVVEHHNGHLWAKGVPGEGATFYIMLPA